MNDQIQPCESSVATIATDICEFPLTSRFLLPRATSVSPKQFRTELPQLDYFRTMLAARCTRLAGRVKSCCCIHTSAATRSWADSYKMGSFYPEIPEGKKPTHIIVGAGSAGCVLVGWRLEALGWSLIFSLKCTMPSGQSSVGESGQPSAAHRGRPEGSLVELEDPYASCADVQPVR